MSMKSKKIWQKRNRPPADEPWIWLTREMIESEAYQSLSRVARRALDRIMVEHMAHRGSCNGELIVTKEDLIRFGVRAKSVAGAIAELVERGLIIRTAKGKSSAGQNRQPSKYALGWIGQHDGAAAPNRWKAWRKRRTPAAPLPSPSPSRNIISRGGLAPGRDGGKQPFLAPANTPDRGRKRPQGNPQETAKNVKSPGGENAPREKLVGSDQHNLPKVAQRALGIGMRDAEAAAHRERVIEIDIVEADGRIRPVGTARLARVLH